MDDGAYFSGDYFSARVRFRDAVSRAGGNLTALAIAAKGPGDEELTIDVGWFGVDDPKRAFVHSAGVHGVEAFAGAAIQLQWLDQDIGDVPEDGAIVLVHVVNPHGMSWLRRVNEQNVDLNRNCLTPDEAYAGAPDGYDAVNDFLNPPSASSHDWFHIRAAWLICRFGMPALKQAIAGGQYVNPEGLFFGGSSLEEGPRLLRQFVRDRMRHVTHLVGIDVHTGLGSFGADTLLVTDAPGSPTFETLRATYGSRVSSPDPGESPAYQATGTYDRILRQALPDAAVYFVVQEFGTYDTVRVLKALRAENRRHHRRPRTSDPVAGSELAAVFNPRDESWRAAVLNRGRAAIRSGLRLAANR
jgi:hypothetical protein